MVVLIFRRTNQEEILVRLIEIPVDRCYHEQPIRVSLLVVSGTDLALESCERFLPTLAKVY